MLHSKTVVLDGLNTALIKRYHGDRHVKVYTFDGGLTATLLDVPGMPPEETRVSMTWGDGVDPGKVLLARLIAHNLLTEQEYTDALSPEPTQPDPALTDPEH